MTPPIPGQVYERDGLRREVLAVTGAAALTRVHWKRPDSEVKQKCWFDYWRAWASKANLVEQFTPAEVIDIRRIEQEAAARVGPRVPFKKVPKRKETP